MVEEPSDSNNTFFCVLYHFTFDRKYTDNIKELFMFFGISFI